MSSGQQGGNSQQSSQTWTEPPWCGWIETTGDALLILEAARRGLIPRVTRRLVDSERKMITSGSVFVFDEDESGIKRWTDGFFWSPSRILGNFLLYRETEKRGNRTPRAAEADTDSQSPDASLSRPKNDTGSVILDKNRERSLCGSLTNSPKFKSDGLMKKTFSLTIGGVAQHLISYYKIEDVEQGRLRTPSSLPELASLEISPEYLDKTHFRTAPKVEIGADGIPRYRGEGDEADSTSGSASPPAHIPHPIEAALPLLTDGHVEPAAPPNKRVPPKQRFLPYNTAPPNRARKRSGSRSQPEAPASIALSPSLSSDSSSPSVVLSPRPSPPTYGNTSSYAQYPYYPPQQVNYQQPAYPQTYPPPPAQPYSYPSYSTHPTVSPDSEAAQSPHSQGTASPDQHSQVAAAPQPYYPYSAPPQPPPAAPVNYHYGQPQPYPTYPAALSGQWGHPYTAPVQYQHQHQHHQYQPPVYHGSQRLPHHGSAENAEPHR